MGGVLYMGTSYTRENMVIHQHRPPSLCFLFMTVVTGDAPWGNQASILYSSCKTWPVSQSILESNRSPSVWKLKLGRNWVIQWHNDPRHTTKSLTEQLTIKRIEVLQWAHQSPDLNMIRMQWWNLQRAVHQQISANLKELKQHCEEAWANIPP